MKQNNPVYPDLKKQAEKIAQQRQFVNAIGMVKVYSQKTAERLETEARHRMENDILNSYEIYYQVLLTNYLEEEKKNSL